MSSFKCSALVLQHADGGTNSLNENAGEDVMVCMIILLLLLLLLSKTEISVG